MEICWGHDTDVLEDVIRDFDGNWTGTGAIENAGVNDTERLALELGEYMVSEVVHTGAEFIEVDYNVYAAGDDVTVYYRHGNTSEACQAAAWNLYAAPFESDGYAQVKLEATWPLRASGSNGRYFVDYNGEPVFLAGFHTWYNPQDGGDSSPPDPLDWDELLEELTDRGLNCIKFWSMESLQNWSDTDGQYFNPPQWERTGPGNANDGGLKVDLAQVNETWLARLRSRAVECLNNGVYVIVQFFQGWQNETDKGGTGDPVTYHPMLAANNINSVDGDDDDDGELLEIHTDADNNAWAYQQDLIEAVIDVLDDLPNVLYEVSNEDTGSANNTDWQEAVIAHIRGYQALDHPVGMTVQYPNGDNSVLDASGADWVSYSGGKADAVHSDSDPVSLYDTDHTVGLTDEYSWLWEAFCNGHGGCLYMDEWDGALYGSDRRENATYVLIRDNLGYLMDLVGLLDNLLLMTPQPDLCSTGYCLARDHASAAEYVCYQDGTGNFTLDLTNAGGTLSIRWLKCADGTTDTGSVSGGAERTLSPPWAGVVVAYVYH